MEAVGVSAINTGIGWHETRIPTVAAMVPRAAFAWVTARLKTESTLPCITSNRINTPQIAEKLLSQGAADLVSMARPLLADPDFVAKSATGRAHLINTCIACNQVCLDHIFTGRAASCLVNPRAGIERRWPLTTAPAALKVAVVGAGPAGLACAVTAALRGHKVDLYDQDSTIGGQLKMAVVIPGKQEFAETLRYFHHQLHHWGVRVHLDQKVTTEVIQAAGYQAVVVATGASPRRVLFPGADHHRVLTYEAILRDAIPVGDCVAIIGAGGIGMDMALFLTQGHDAPWKDRQAFLRHWEIDENMGRAGGLSDAPLPAFVPRRKEYLLQRKKSKIGAGLGVTTGWVHRMELVRRKVMMLTGVTYQGVDNQGLHIMRRGETFCLAVDHVVVCAGQESRRDLAEALQAKGVPVHCIGGADQVAGLDAHAAISQGIALGWNLG